MIAEVNTQLLDSVSFRIDCDARVDVPDCLKVWENYKVFNWHNLDPRVFFFKEHNKVMVCESLLATSDRTLMFNNQ